MKALKGGYHSFRDFRGTAAFALLAFFGLLWSLALQLREFGIISAVCTATCCLMTGYLYRAHLEHIPAEDRPRWTRLKEDEAPE